MSAADEATANEPSTVRANFARAVGETLLWWLLGAGFWLVTLTARPAQELVLAVLGALPVAVTARPARQANAGQWRFRIGWLGWVGTVLRELPVQAVQVWAYALITARRRCSTISEVWLPAEPEPVGAARRAAALLVLAATPATVVLDTDRRTQRLLLHRIRQHPGDLETRVQR